MSAFVVDRNTIRVLVEAALIVGERPGRRGFSVFHNGARVRVVEDDQSAGHAGEISASEFGQRLWDENIRSVLYRYPQCGTPGGGYDPENLPGGDEDGFKYTHRRAFGWTPEPGLIFSAINCIDYQSCEHDEWEASFAWRALYQLRCDWCDRVPGDVGFNIPEIPESSVIRLSDLCRRK